MIKESQGQAQTYISYEILLAHQSRPDVLDLINKGRTEYIREFQKGIIYEWNLDGMSKYQVVDMIHHMYICYRTYLTLGKQNPTDVGHAIIAILLKIMKVFVNEKQVIAMGLQ